MILRHMWILFIPDYFWLFIVRDQNYEDQIMKIYIVIFIKQEILSSNNSKMFQWLYKH